MNAINGRWTRTGFDPTRPAGNVAETDMTSKRVDYRRAEAACLEGRGYTVGSSRNRYTPRIEAECAWLTSNPPSHCY